MEEVVAKVMKGDKVVELFQTMAIVSLNMGNLTLKVNTLENVLAIGKKEKTMLQEELNKRKISKRDINVEIQRKNMAKVKYKNKVFIKKLQDENEELYGSTTQLKLLDEELQDLKHKVEIQETIEKKWIKVVFFHKK